MDHLQGIRESARVIVNGYVYRACWYIYTDVWLDFTRPPESSECLMQRQMSLKHHYLEDGINDAFEMQIRGMTCILTAGINSILAGCVEQALRV